MTTLETSRLVLRPHRSSDLPGLFALHADVEAARLIPRKPATDVAAVEATFARLTERSERGEVLPFVVTLRGEDAPIGVVGFASIDRANAGAKVAWELSRAHWGRGLMSEAAARVVAHGFDVLGLHRLEAHIHPDNRPSMRLAERLGFVREGVLRDNYRFEDRFTDTVMFAKLSTDPR